MSVAASASTAERELSDLYGRYKALVLAVAAAVMLDRPFADVTHEAVLLLDDCRTAAASATDFDEQFGACTAAAAQLSRVLDAAGGRLSEAQLEEVRTSHRRVRRDVWNVLPCEYVPCCARAHTHAHR
jgi:hypothetical protein